MRMASDDIAGLLEASAAGDERAKSVLYELAKLFCGTLAVIVGCTLCLAAVVRLSPSPFLRMPLPNRLSSSERMCEWGTSHGRAPCSSYNSVGAPEISEWYSAHVWSSVSVACMAGLDVLLLLLQGWWQETRHEDGVRSAKGAHQSCSLVSEAPIKLFSSSKAPSPKLQLKGWALVLLSSSILPMCRECVLYETHSRHIILIFVDINEVWAPTPRP
jgi:hypothetical protein